MQKMIADSKFTYRSVQLSVGQQFDADDEHVSLLTLIGHAHVPQGQSYETRVMTAAEPRSRRRGVGA